MDKNLIREKNVKLIKQTLFKKKKGFASDLAKEIGVSNVTIHAILKELVHAGVIAEGSLIQKDVGRPAVEYLFNDNFSHFLLLTIKEKKPQKYLEIFAQLVNLDGRIKQQQTLSFTLISPEFLRKVIEDLLKRWGTVDYIGLMLPGKIHEGRISESWHDRFKGWDLFEEIEKKIKIPVIAQNDAHVMTIGYALQKKVSKKETLVGIYYPSQSSPGITIYSKGELIEGNHSLAGEGKYLPSFLGKPAPQNDQELIDHLFDILPFYNAAIAPHRFIISSDRVENEVFDRALFSNKWLTLQPNQPSIEYIENFQELITLGLRGLIHQQTPYTLE